MGYSAIHARQYSYSIHHQTYNMIKDKQRISFDKIGL